MTPPVMAWPTDAEFKAYLRVQTTAEDDVITAINLAAKAAILGYIGRAVDSSEIVCEDAAITLNVYQAVRKLYTTDWPVATDPAPVITDGQGTVVQASTYSWLPLIGCVRANRGIYFSMGPYLLTVTVGLVYLPDFEARVQPLLRAAVLDLGAVRYQQRNAAAQHESEQGVAAQWGPEQIPPRIQAMIANLRRPSQRIGQRVS